MRVSLNLTLIALSVAVTWLSSFGSDLYLLSRLTISTSPYNLSEIANGEIWRLISPVFLHLNIYHIVFNMLWLYLLGNEIEQAAGKLFYLIFFLITAAVGNLAQFYVDGPLFGGMSGVVYALFGYVWMQSKINPAYFGCSLHRSTVPVMMIWFLVCWTGLAGNIANTAHTAGLVAGICWGILHAVLFRVRKRRNLPWLKSPFDDH